MFKQTEDFFQLFTIVAMGLTRQVVDFSYKNMKIGSLIFIINYIGFKNGCTMTDVITYLNLKPSTATRQLDILVNKLKLVVREHSIEDRRVINLTLTSLGKEVYDHHKEIGDSIAKIVLSKISEQEIQILYTAMNELKSVFTLNLNM